MNGSPSPSHPFGSEGEERSYPAFMRLPWEYKRTGDPWNAVNASSHYRKCEQTAIANELLNSIPAHRVTSKKLKSALASTHGGVIRDLEDFDKALQFGISAHAMTPKDFRPGTLLGAVNFDLGNYAEGKEWFDKAVERGATERSIDAELRGILLRADKVEREKIRACLIEKDPVRYQWCKHLR